MNDLFKKIFLTGLGAVAYTAEKAGEVIDELVKKGEITFEQGKEMAKEYKEKFDAQKTEFDAKVEEKVDQVLGNLNVVTKDDLSRIMDRLDAIEKNLQKKD